MWSDLLGFGSAFEKGKWTFESQDALRNVSRLQLLSNSFYVSNFPFKEIAFVINDGLARVFDFPKPEYDANALLWWLSSTISNHWIVNAHDSEYGNPGMRSVLCFGERVQTWRGNTTLGDLVLGNTKFKRTADKKIIIYSPEEFQLNLAFTKAYILESLGSKHGLTGPCLFFDNDVLDAIENYLTFGKRNLLEIDEIEVVTELPEPFESSTPESSTPLMVQVKFRVKREVNHGIFRYEIFRELSDEELRIRNRSEREIQVMAIEFNKEPIVISHRGIIASLWRVIRFNPIDEEVPFYFDFEDYSFRPPETFEYRLGNHSA